MGKYGLSNLYNTPEKTMIKIGEQNINFKYNIYAQILFISNKVLNESFGGRFDGSGKFSLMISNKPKLLDLSGQ